MLSGNHFYNQTLRKTVAVFGTIFNNILIKRHNSVSERVPISYGARQKFLARIEQESRTDEAVAIKLPRMAFNITDIAYDASIKLNTLDAKFVANIHDEWQMEVREDIANFVGELAVNCIIKAGEYYNLRCPMDGEYKIGENWSETH